FDIAKASSISILFLVAVSFFIRRYEFSRLILVYFWISSIIMLSFARGIFREFLRFMRKKGYNLRYALIVGTGNLAEGIVKKIELHPELGIKIAGFLRDKKEATVNNNIQPKIIGTHEDINKVIAEKNIDQVFIALPLKENDKLFEILKTLGDEMIEIRIVPDLYQLATLHGGVEEFEGMFLINLQGSPLYGWNRVIKRAADIIFSLIALLITLPLMLLIAAAVKLTSRGPVFYRQTRMGLDGKVFQMLKFRSMRIDAEKETGAVWARENDHRRTRFGSFLRRTSLDELPQFINVLKGDMSIVGPRPERPVFIEDFRKKIPRYMLRHKMKAGITGWAQVNGWRGNTSLEKRIECDLFYIKNWSLFFDLKIMWLTVWKGLINKNAY
ncbi:MAG: undecaprenyl-phosphate glucose phosphotransferase, partial [Nitrospirae bacterium]|nr:undecaprenyl-phosphate glucose phosphotransferase [Nitrospirota bacterium]